MLAGEPWFDLLLSQDEPVVDGHGFAIGATAIACHDHASCGLRAERRPWWKKIKIDMIEIISGHTAKGHRYKQSGKKDKFYDNMSPQEIESVVRQAYRNATKAGRSQGGVYKMRGKAGGMTIEMWVNTKTKEIETAYPVGRE